MLNELVALFKDEKKKKYQLLKHYLVQILLKWEKPLKEKPLQILNEDSNKKKTK